MDLSDISYIYRVYNQKSSIYNKVFYTLKYIYYWQNF